MIHGGPEGAERVEGATKPTRPKTKFENEYSGVIFPFE
jgi:hypothetical protein